ncbi:MAG: universal stress protein [Syntrophomonas sp.]|nr:universal stress protein [Syntrophomonas sp.]
MFKTILVAYDDGEQAAKALNTAIDIAGKMSAQIFICSAYTIPTNDWERYATMVSVPAPKDKADTFHQHLHKYLLNIQAEAAEKVRQANIPVQTAVKQGRSGPVIIQTAKDLQAGLIVIGSHNRSGVGQFFLGSVSTYVLNNAPCPVLVIKE